MFTSDLKLFLTELKENNNKEWFASQKSRYDEIKDLLNKYVAALIEAMTEYEPDFQYLQPKDCLFRIHRDTRFANDKTPYKTNIGVYISKNGKNGGYAGYYLHIEPDKCFVAGGVYQPEKNVLAAIRTEIVNNYQDFHKILNQKDLKKEFELSGEKLKKIPRGFAEDFEGGEYLKMKDIIVSKDFSDDILTQKEGLNFIIDNFRKIKPLNDFFNQIITDIN